MKLGDKMNKALRGGNGRIALAISLHFRMRRQALHAIPLTTHKKQIPISEEDAAIRAKGASQMSTQSRGIVAFGLSLVAVLFMALGDVEKATAQPILFPDNGHYYDFVPDVVNWHQAKAAAELMTFLGVQGHLATVTSQAEHDFLLSTFPAASAHAGPWLGGFQPAGSPEPAGGWTWITGEPFVFTIWRAGEPNNANGEDALHMSDAQWNDLDSNGLSAVGYLVEFEPAPVPAVAVILVHGFDGSSGSFSADGKLFDQVGLECLGEDAKVRPECLPRMGRLLQDVSGVTVAQGFDYEDKTPDGNRWGIRQLAGELHKHIECVLSGNCISPVGTKVDLVDVVAHSMGGLIARAYIAGLAVDETNRDAPIPYNGKIRKLVMLGTPNYGAAGAFFIDQFGVRTAVEQVEEMEFGSGFIWDLHENWGSGVLPENRMPASDVLIISGTQDAGLFEGDDDGVVNIASSALPVEFLPSTQIRYLPYRHADVATILPADGLTLAGVHDETHCAFRFVRDHLLGAPVPDTCDGYSPPFDITRRGLLLLRLIDKETLRPISPTNLVAFVIDGVEAARFNNRGAGSITVFPIVEGLHTISIVPRGGKYQEPAPITVDIQGGRPNILTVELARRR